MNIKQVWGVAGGFFVAYVLISLTNRPILSPKTHPASAPMAPGNQPQNPPGAMLAPGLKPRFAELAGGPASNRAQATATSGFGYLAAGDGELSGTGFDQEIELASASGAKQFVISLPIAMDKATSAEVSPDPQRTPSKDAIVKAIGHCHDKGLQVMLRPVVEVKDGSPRWQINPPPNLMIGWVSEYNKAITPFLEAAEEGHADVFCVASSLSNLDRNCPWTQMFEKARSIYHGKLTYGAAIQVKEGYSGYSQISFWRNLDYIGIEGPLPTPAKPGADIPWSALASDIESFRNTNGLSQPVLFTGLEVQTFPAGDASPNPALPPPRPSELDGAAQASAVKGFYQAIGDQPWCGGVTWTNGTPGVSLGQDAIEAIAKGGAS